MTDQDSRVSQGNWEAVWYTWK